VNTPEEKRTGKGDELDFQQQPPQEIGMPPEWLPGDQGLPTKMIFEEDLRKAAGPRALNLSEQQEWINFRKKLPLNHWLEHSRNRRLEKKELRNLEKKLEHYLETFATEAKELNLTLDMERNYYKEAVNLVSRYSLLEAKKFKKQESLKELMVMVDYKDATLACQILQSII
jgi:hypothetical protein